MCSVADDPTQHDAMSIDVEALERALIALALSGDDPLGPDEVLVSIALEPDDPAILAGKIAAEYARLVPTEDEGRETIDQQASRMQRERQARVLARKPAEDEGRLREALDSLPQWAMVGPMNNRHMEAVRPGQYWAIADVRAALAATPEPQT